MDEIKLESDTNLLDKGTTCEISPDVTNFAEFCIELITPPLIIVGSNFVSSNIDAIKDVVVVLPCDPTTTIFFVKETMLASISALL